MNNPDTKRKQELLQKDARFVFHPFGLVGREARIIWERGEGARLWDIDGKEYIDLESGGAQYSSLGYHPQELIDAAYEQMQKMSHIGTAAPYTTTQVIEYAAELAEVLPGDINRSFFSCNGTDATENAIKIAKLFWNIQGKASKYKVICLREAYHGASHFAASIVGMPVVRMNFGPEALGVVRVPNFHCYHCAFGLKYPDCGIRCAYFVEDTIEAEGEDSVACMIAEPIQGYAGVIMPPPEYWPIVRRICAEHNVLLICDEVQTGFCRTGKMFAAEHWNMVPDIMTMSKGMNNGFLPLAATAVSDRVYEGLRGHPYMAGVNNQGNAIVVATGRAALKIYREKEMARKSAQLGEHIRHRLFGEFLPLPCVEDIMGSGCYMSFEVALGKTTGHKASREEQEKVAADIMGRLLEKGVVPPVVRARRVTITPAFVITEEELDRGLDILLEIMQGVKPV
jgi:adenosylmethionine-8-amino-7-oxononanoate aminotransferase